MRSSGELTDTRGSTASERSGYRPGDESEPTLRWRRLLLALVFALSCLPFLPALSQGWVDWDDDYNFVKNPMWRGLTQANVDWMFSTDHIYMGNYQPLTWLSFAVEYELWGESPQRMHLVNVLLHALNAVLFTRLATRLLAWHRGAPPGAEPFSAWIGGVFAALFFAVHPLRVESVAWATERRDVLSTLFLLACVLSWLRTKSSSDLRWLWWIATLACYACSLLSKAWGMTLPALLVLLELYPLRTAAPTFKGIARSALSMWPFVPFAVWCGWAAMRAQELIGAAVSWSEHPLSNRVAQAAWGSVFYLWKTLLPTGLSPLYHLEADFDPWGRDYVVAMSVAVAITLGLFFARKRFPAGLAVWIAFLILASPVLGLTQSGAQKAADRYTYLSCLPYAALAGGALMSLAQRRTPRDKAFQVVALTLAAVLVALGAGSFRQTRFWKDSESLWRRVIAVETKSYLAYHNLAVTIGEKGREAEAIELERRGVALNPGAGNMEARNYLAALQLRVGKPDESLASLIEAFHVDPTHAGVLRSLDSALARRGERARIYTLFEEVLAKDPARAQVRMHYAERLLMERRTNEAEAQYKAALATDPNFVPALAALGRMYVSSGRATEAEPLLVRAMRIEPTNPDVFAELGAVRATQNRLDEALTLFSQALYYNPNHPRATALMRQYSSRRPGG